MTLVRVRTGPPGRGMCPKSTTCSQEVHSGSLRTWGRIRCSPLPPLSPLLPAVTWGGLCSCLRDSVLTHDHNLVSSGCLWQEASRSDGPQCHQQGHQPVSRESLPCWAGRPSQGRAGGTCGCSVFALTTCDGKPTHNSCLLEAGLWGTLSPHGLQPAEPRVSGKGIKTR